MVTARGFADEVFTIPVVRPIASLDTVNFSPNAGGWMSTYRD